MDILVFIPVLVLIGLHLVTLGPNRPSLKGAAMVWITGLLLFGLIRVLVPDELLFRESEIVRRAQSQLRHLRKQKDWSQHPVIILTGSSLSLVGIDGDSLEKILRDAGQPATVLQFNMAGANHVERLHLLDVFVNSLKPKERMALEQAHVVLLSEVMRRYDEHPLVFLTKDEYAERARVYLTLQNAWAGYCFHLLDSRADTNPVPALIENTLAQFFAIGTFSDMKIPGRIRGIGGYFPLKKPDPNFSFTKTWAEREIEPLPVSTPSTHPFPWWKEYREELQERQGVVIDQTGFYALPTLAPEERLYQHTLHALLPAGSTMLEPDSEVYRKLAQGELWFDAYHVQESGAVRTTEWLAAEILEHWDELMRSTEN